MTGLATSSSRRSSTSASVLSTRVCLGIVTDFLSKDNSEKLELLSSADDVLFSKPWLDVKLDHAKSFGKRTAMSVTRVTSSRRPTPLNPANLASDDGVKNMIAPILAGEERSKILCCSD